jgi:ABC-type multidrug transport system ATPase subunit
MNPQAFVALTPNGVGSTTLSRMLLSLTSASSGTMRLLGPTGAR